MTDREILLKAADLIEQAPILLKSMWYMEKPEGNCFCIGGAVMWSISPGATATYRLPEGGMAVMDRVMQRIGRQLDPAADQTKHEAIGRVMVWNDEPTTTREDAVRLLREAANAIR